MHLVFDTENIKTIIPELQKAQKYIRIAVFQIHHKDLFEVLDKKCKEGIRVEIITLPYDSINEDAREAVTARFKGLENRGAKLYFAKWNVGDPGRSTTAEGRWYSFHGKFIITDKSAIALSANFTEDNDLNISVIENSANKIAEFNEQFDRLRSLFCEDEIRTDILKTDPTNATKLFSPPPSIHDEIIKKHWIRHYPVALCAESANIDNKLYLTPFDCKGREFFDVVLNSTKKEIFISTESFTDPEMSELLIKLSLKGIKIRLLTGATSQDFQDRLNSMFKEMLASNIDIRTRPDLHAKMLITDDYLVISSLNLNKINLGFYQTKKYWRENTETIYVLKDAATTQEAKTLYLNIFNNESKDIREKLAETAMKKVKKIVKRIGVKMNKQSKDSFASFILESEINNELLLNNILKISVKLLNIFKNKAIDNTTIISALVLNCLFNNKNGCSFDTIKFQIKIDEKMVRAAIDILSEKKIIMLDDGIYHIQERFLTSRPDRI